MPLFIKLFELEGIYFEIKDCLCEQKSPLPNELEVALVHPHYDGKDSCWPNIKKTIQENPEKYFFVFAINAEEREKTIGKSSNLIYINNSSLGKWQNQLSKIYQNNKLASPRREQ